MNDDPNIDNDNPIICFRRPSNQTSIDYREKFSLQSKYILIVCQLSHQIHEEEDIYTILTSLLLLLSQINNRHNESEARENDARGTRFDMRGFRNELGLPQELPFREDNKKEASSYKDNQSGSLMSCNSYLSSLNCSDASSSNSISINSNSESSRSSYRSNSGTSPPFLYSNDWNVQSIIDNLESTYFSPESLVNVSIFSQGPNDYQNIMSVSGTILGCSMLVIDEIVTSIIDVTAICQHEWDSVIISTNSAKKNRMIGELGSDCYHYTRFSP